jgi:hypothetical protein
MTIRFENGCVAQFFEPVGLNRNSSTISIRLEAGRFSRESTGGLGHHVGLLPGDPVEPDKHGLVRPTV